ncbi:MAG: hypothetical protein H0S85_07280 [Desulfovibrionaceae bacterium]|nr:hypothetical protein [Desulfovibrionaceae bacterium]
MQRIAAWRLSRRTARELRRELDPESFRALARELAHLARLAEGIWPREHEFHGRIKHIQAEMERLERLAGGPSFRRLPPEKRLELRASLLQSRTQLIETVATAPSPTTRLQ